jgi:hypothetical protein
MMSAFIFLCSALFCMCMRPKRVNVTQNRSTICGVAHRWLNPLVSGLGGFDAVLPCEYNVQCRAGRVAMVFWRTIAAEVNLRHWYTELVRTSSSTVHPSWCYGLASFNRN